MLEQMCRTCLATCGELVPIFSNDYYVHNLPDKLLHTTKIEVLIDDPLPKLMCKKCIFLVDSLYCFKDQCEMAEIKLKKTLTGTFDNDVCVLNIFASNDKNYDSYNFDGAEVHSDDITSSEEEYHIEYASEEARLEVENARRRSRNAKKKRNEYSAIKVKSVEILPESKSNIYKNLSTGSTFKCEVSEIDEDINISDSDDISSIYTSEGSKKFTSKEALKKKDHHNLCNTDEKINFFKNQKHSKLQDDSTSMKLGSKRKSDSSNTNSNRLSKVPKKVMFKESDYIEENIQFIEITENHENKTSENIELKNDDLTIINFNANQNDSVKVSQNYDISSNNDSSISNNLINSLSTYDLSNESPDGDTKKVLELRMQNIINRIVLNIPEVCTICLQSFQTYLDVLKHKIETHLGLDQDFYFCPICQEKFLLNNDLIQHLNEHKDLNSFVCILCSGNFYTEETLRTHLYTHVDLRDLRCHICSKKFIRIQTLLNHLEQHITSKQLVCTLCADNNFKDKDVLQSHINEEHRNDQQWMKTKCETCGIEVSEEERMEHMKNHVTYPCPYCESSFTTKIILRDHVLTHLGVHQYSCLVCEKTFVSQDERTQHMQEHMKPQQKNDQKKFRCRVCHEILVSRIAYGQHLKEQHWSAKQTSEILQELSESSLNEKVNDQFSNSSFTPPASESKS